VPGFRTGLGAALADLVLPAACAGCGVDRVPLRFGTCDGCAAELEALTPFPTTPDPPPYGMPACTAVGAYGEPLRSVLLAYKEKGRHRLARPLGALLAAAIAGAAVRGGGGPGVPVTVLPVPSTARAARERHGDHMARLAAQAVRRLRTAGWQADVTQPLRALPRPDSASLDAAARVAAAESSLRIRASRIRVLQRELRMKGTLIVVDDIVTTGATLAAVAARLEEANMQVTGAAVLAATRLRRAGKGGFTTLPPQGSGRSDHHVLGSPNEG
jgi:predicted amidophosphoribosyltransferase